eukprot:Opistho-2@4157
MDAYDRKALIDVIDWHKARKDAKTTAPTAEGGGYFGWIWSCVPQSVVDYSTSAVSRALLSVETYAMDAAALAAIDEYMRTFAVSKGIQGGDISRLTLQHRDEIAASYCSPAAIAAFLQGAGLGLGGVFFCCSGHSHADCNQLSYASKGFACIRGVCVCRLQRKCRSEAACGGHRLDRTARF